MQQVSICNLVPSLVHLNEAAAMVAVLQTQYDRDFHPAWPMLPAIKITYAPSLKAIPAGAWVIFLNKHSTDPGALGWHDDEAGRIFARVFVGDCLRYGLDWGVTLSHELIEMALDPDVKKVWRMPNGRLAAYEACDACEADELGYLIDGHRVSDFVLPAYFSTSTKGPFDFGKRLAGPCPSLTPGGYMSVTDAHGQWTQVNADMADHLASKRALIAGFRRRARRAAAECEIVKIPSEHAP